ncbi:3-deoxy-manno-octulosonate cytidylyltransferase [Thermodesulfovibrionales bacterium]|nr:3-deoxy-manno-octulosonate cytidylyltransferase [Thermodesulfovibrionales bacterium]MCL0030268.1 3-deoxy-manno-octulosonate cytidylyltransferase [Thermodesulfovibrionales bacterium]MCL0035083.1 3-deoxy-manno-octulosonate cytidylyltransferase [Thermodesulfovibrionales bacterium]MCL0046836.1 3-deoxy-manno-octulosonate cytidylyltransferase [Thermodesulfovibrionales bacterium]MCL0051191.1 3-deoxy-manno-octulosonate cytidylyltransferase [Thermodesulfovibrionales bacterium]
MSAIAIIPSRYGSTRLKGKSLISISGKPMIQHVYERASEAKLIKDVFVATDNKLIFDKVKGFGGRAIMTSERHLSGTDRVAEAVLKIKNDFHVFRRGDIVVNIQGDEPTIRPQMIDDVIILMDDKRASIGTLSKRIENAGDIIDRGVVKVVFDSEGFVLYFSRSPIPYHMDEWKEEGKHLSSSIFMYKHVGIYAYRVDVLLEFSNLPPTRLEFIEKLEQLRAIENGIRIKIRETEFETISVDTYKDIERAEKCLNLYS